MDWEVPCIQKASPSLNSFVIPDLPTFPHLLGMFQLLKNVLVPHLWGIHSKMSPVDAQSYRQYQDLHVPVLSYIYISYKVYMSHTIRNKEQ